MLTRPSIQKVNEERYQDCQFLTYGRVDHDVDSVSWGFLSRIGS